ncbi:MAG: MBL fold metallo-hydrolase [Phycisphaeraceae bacterium]|nr:MBL fold metallo-hydrolase [Phycisphaeraceae bacterium]
MSPLSPSAPAYSWTLLRAGAFRLDAGSMFGLIPRTVWSRAVPTDDRGRMSVQHNCLLLESGGKRLLIETGTGDKLDPRSRDIFSLEDRSILTALAEINLNPSDIHGVAVSHLHFDHAGGLTRLCRDGEAPDWTGPAGGMAGTRPDHAVKRTFPSATLFVQQQEWQDARLNRSVMTRTYFQDHLEPLADRLHLLHAPPPFTPHDNPLRDQLPSLPFEERVVPLPGFPGVGAFLTPGHTWGQQALIFRDTTNQTVVFVPDVLPTIAHAGQAYSLAYDVEPYTSCVTKHWLLSEAADRHWLLVLDHEPANPCVRVTRNDRGWFDLHPQPTP